MDLAAMLYFVCKNRVFTTEERKSKSKRALIYLKSDVGNTENKMTCNQPESSLIFS
jgi:hypothetical protein